MPEIDLVDLWYIQAGRKHECGKRPRELAEMIIAGNRCRSIQWGYDELQPSGQGLESNPAGRGVPPVPPDLRP